MRWDWRAAFMQSCMVHVVEPMGLFAESVLQSYLDEQALNELHRQGMSTMLSNIELRVLESLREELAGWEQELALIHSVKVIGASLRR